MKNKAPVHIGTSGWHYDHWKGPFYPKDRPKEKLLEYYARHFHTVEINNSFYKLPEKKTLRAWKDLVPKTFTFSVKANRYITHMKKLKQASDAVSNMLTVIDVLEDNLGPILFQLPPRWKFNAERLESFLKNLPGGYRYSFEFRDPSWMNKECYQLLQHYKAAFCIYHISETHSPKEITAPFIYIRLHGPANAYEGCYDTQTLAGWAGAISTWRRQGREVYCYFDNDQHGYAAENALKLQQML